MAVDPDPNQQGDSDCEGGQQALVLGELLPEEDDQSGLSGVRVSGVAVQQAGTEGACLRGGPQRRAPRLQSLLMRLIDDFLFITPSRTAAEALVNKLLKGMHLTKMVAYKLYHILSWIWSLSVIDDRSEIRLLCFVWDCILHVLPLSVSWVGMASFQVGSLLLGTPMLHEPRAAPHDLDQMVSGRRCVRQPISATQPIPAQVCFGLQCGKVNRAKPAGLAQIHVAAA